MQHANPHSIAKMGTIDWRARATQWLTDENKRKSGVMPRRSIPARITRVKIIISPLPLVPADLIRVLAILGWLPPHFLASSFAGQSLFYPLFLTGLEIKGVFLSFFYDV